MRATAHVLCFTLETFDPSLAARHDGTPGEIKLMPLGIKHMSAVGANKRILCLFFANKIKIQAHALSSYVIIGLYCYQGADPRRNPRNDSEDKLCKLFHIGRNPPLPRF